MANKKTMKVYLYRRTEGDSVTCSEYEFDQSRPDKSYILIGSGECTFDLLPEDEQVKAVVASLELAKESIRAELQSEINRIDQKIQSLLAITHQD